MLLYSEGAPAKETKEAAPVKVDDDDLDFLGDEMEKKRRQLRRRESWEDDPGANFLCCRLVAEATRTSDENGVEDQS